MIKFFSKSHTITLIFLPLIAILLSVFSFAELKQIDTSNSMLFFDFTEKYINSFTFVSVFVGLFIIVCQAIIINNIVTSFEIVRNSYLTAFIFIVFNCSNINFISYNPCLTANLFVLLSLNSIFSLYERESDKNIFNASFFISIASLFYFPTLLLIPIAFIGIISLRSTNIREIFIVFSGLLIPYCFVLTGYFWFDGVGALVHNSFMNVFSTSFKFEIKNNYIIFLAISGLIVFFGIIKVMVNMSENVVRLRKFQNIVIWMFSISLISYVFLDKKSINHLILVFTPISIIVSKYFLNIKKKWVAEFVSWILIASILVLGVL